MAKIETVCIIDDDPIVVFGVRKMIENANFCENFLVFKNGKEGLEGLKSIMAEGGKLPDIVLLDLNMPVLDGWGFLEEFTKVPSPKKMLIYIVTSSVDPADVSRAKQYDNVNNYLVKPVSKDALLKILEDIDID